MPFAAQNLRAVRGHGRRLAVAAAAAAVLLTAACSSSGGTSSGASNTGGSTAAQGDVSAGVAQAKAIVAKAEAPQPTITLPALPSKPAAGKTIGILGCPLPVCTKTTDGITAAAHVLGWKTTLVIEQLTPESYIAGFNQLVTLKPDFVAYAAVFPNATIHAQLEALHSAGTKVIGIVSSDPVGPLMQADFTGPASIARDATLLADLVVADAGKSVHALYMTGATTKSTFAPGIAAFKNTLVSRCPKCKSTELDVTTSNIGRIVPGQVVSAIQRDPSIKYVVADSDDYLVGVYSALQSAGLASTVKIVGRGPSRQSMAAVRDGQQFATLALENSTIGYRVVDAFARLSENMALGACCAAPVGFAQIITRSNIPATGALAADGTVKVPGDPSAFTAAWHVG